MSIVSIVKTVSDDEKGIAEAVKRAVGYIGGIEEVVFPGDLVLVKPNLVRVPPSDNGTVTRREVTKAVADLVMERGARPVIAESAAAGVDTEAVMKAAGYDRLRALGYEVVDLKSCTREVIPVPEGYVAFGELPSWDLVRKADAIISVPVMKTHDQTEVTLSMKNLKGLIDDSTKKAFHREGLLEGVVDLMTALKPRLTVMDGTICQEGMGPIFGTPKRMDLILASKDLVAADAVAGKIMGYDPAEVMITARAAARGVGEMDLERIHIVGDAGIDEVAQRFKRSSETSLEGLPPFELVFDEGACTGCRNSVISALLDMKKHGIESALEGKIIVAGPLQEEDLPQGATKENTVLVGICTRHLRDRGAYVQGCPPLNNSIIEGITDDGQKAASRYDQGKGETLRD
jgi:uncharacterized protein (DUF362 family)